MSKEEDNIDAATFALAERATRPAGQGGIAIRDMEDLVRFCKPLAASGFFSSARDVASAIVAVEYGLELGIPPVAAVMNVHVIEGRPSMSSGMIAARIKQCERYDYRIREHTNKVCKVETFEKVDGKWLSLGVTTFTWQDAVDAGVSGRANWKRYPRNMLFARAISNAAKWNMPDLFLGPIYTADELASGDYVDETVTVAVEEQAVDVPQEVAASAPAKDLASALDIVMAMNACENADDLRGVVERIDPAGLDDDDIKLVGTYRKYMARNVAGDTKAMEKFMADENNADLVKRAWALVEESEESVDAADVPPVAGSLPPDDDGADPSADDVEDAEFEDADDDIED